MNRSESKYKNTAEKMQTALIDLLEEKKFEEITVVDVCKAAGVNRSTFYSHYGNTYDLLEEGYRNKLREFGGYFDRTLTTFEGIEKERLIFVSPEYLLPYLEFVKNNKKFFKIYMTHLSSFNVDRAYSTLYENVFVPVCEKNGVKDRRMINYMAKFYLQGINSLVLEWVTNDCSDDTEYISSVIMMCVRPYIKE